MSAAGVAACLEHSWCTVRPASEHNDGHHGGDIVDLAGSDGSGRTGWWGWLWRDQTHPLMVELEGHPTPGATVECSSVDAGAVAAVLAATATPEARAALVAALAAAGVEVSS